MNKAYIHHYLNWQNEKIFRDGELISQADPTKSEQDWLLDYYQKQRIHYPKFFKMDLMSRLGFLASCSLMEVCSIETPSKTGIICSTCDGSLEVDKAFEQSRREIPSPALFVYTLPNIALGEICIFHKIKGPQACFIEEKLNSSLLFSVAQDYFSRERADSLIIGHINAIQNQLVAQLAWVNKNPNAADDREFNAATMEQLFL